MNYTGKQIAAIVHDTLERTMTIARHQGVIVTIDASGSSHEMIQLAILAELHKAAANNLGQVLAHAMGDADL